MLKRAPYYKMDSLISAFQRPKHGMAELVFPEIISELIAVRENDTYANYRVKHAEYAYTYNVFYLYYDGIISDRELVEKWAKLLQRNDQFCFAEYRVYNAIRRSPNGAVYHINPRTKKNYFTDTHIAAHIDQVDSDMQSIITRTEQGGHQFYVHRVDHEIDNTIHRVLGDVIRRKTTAVKSVRFDVDFSGSHLSPSQQAVIEHINKHNLTIATGGAGTGKTTIIVEIIKAHVLSGSDRPLFILTPTHMAANNVRDRLVKYFERASDNDDGTSAGISISDVLATVFISTGHQFGYRLKSHPVNALIIFEEASMYDNILGNLLRLNENNFYDCKYLFIGDPNQLPPASRSSTLKMIIGAFGRWHLKLGHNYRSGDIIIKNSNRVIDFEPQGRVIFDTNNNFRIDAQNALDKLALEQYYSLADARQLAPDDVMFITYRNADVLAINRVLRDHYFAAKGIVHSGDIVSESRVHNLFKDGKLMGAWEWRVGDKARCLENTPHIFNGSICTVRGFIDAAIMVEYKGRLITVSHRKLWPAYCITVHNSQGQEWDRVVFCDLSNKPIDAALLYVGITRGKNEVFIARICDDTTITEFAFDQGPTETYFDE